MRMICLREKIESQLFMFSKPQASKASVNGLRRRAQANNLLIMKFLSRLFRRPQKDEDEEDESIDPMNPFPDPVVIQFTDVIDLHSIPPRQVKAVVEDFLQSARSRRLSHVRIIHGKGIGVQREMVRAILSRTPFVISFNDAPMEAGGWGATVAVLDTSEEG
jgi:hypothetical protein